ncbi:TetR family transcriptional regulator [Microbispora hainanensis]|uniref:TetR family transcriptional regulator n=2 Tax=Microbispora hainanensis TaxID=568844 RepID=UPI002E2C21AD|nr:TetR family transcriptional regulator [Microbispora hainanensis]
MPKAQQPSQLGKRPLRADSERTVRTILEAAERVFAANPAATMEQVAQAAGVARTTVHRRFATREALVEELTGWAARRFAEAVESAHADSTPPLVALYQVTANVLRVKTDWWFAMNRTADDAHPEAARVHAKVRDDCERLLRRAREAGVLRPDADIDWTRRVYYALIHEAAAESAARDTSRDTSGGVSEGGSQGGAGSTSGGMSEGGSQGGAEGTSENGSGDGAWGTSGGVSEDGSESGVQGRAGDRSGGTSGSTSDGDSQSRDAEALATRVVDTLLRGFGSPSAPVIA